MVPTSFRGAPVREAVIAGHRGDVESAARLTDHTEPAVRAAALGALDRMGVLETGALVDALTDPHPVMRRRACVLAGRALGTEGPHPELVDALVSMLSSDPDATVVESGAWALGEGGSNSGQGAVAALASVVRRHADALCREAAVAALGAIGDPAALDVVLVALGDKPAVRRRAVIALAAFDDPRVEVALRRCLDDRDWQVRQAAEDLLDRP